MRVFYFKNDSTDYDKLWTCEAPKVRNQQARVKPGYNYNIQTQSPKGVQSFIFQLVMEILIFHFRDSFAVTSN